MKMDQRTLEMRIRHDYENALEELAKGWQNPQKKWIGLTSFGSGAHEYGVQYNPLGIVFNEKYLVVSSIEDTRGFNSVINAYKYAMKHSKLTKDYSIKD